MNKRVTRPYHRKWYLVTFCVLKFRRQKVATLCRFCDGLSDRAGTTRLPNLDRRARKTFRTFLARIPRFDLPSVRRVLWLPTDGREPRLPRPSTRRRSEVQVLYGPFRLRAAPPRFAQCKHAGAHTYAALECVARRRNVVSEGARATESNHEHGNPVPRLESRRVEIAAVTTVRRRRSRRRP